MHYTGLGFGIKKRGMNRRNDSRKKPRQKSKLDCFEEGDFVRVKDIVKKGFNVNQKFEKEINWAGGPWRAPTIDYPISASVRKNHHEIVRFLLSVKNIQVNIIYHQGGGTTTRPSGKFPLLLLAKDLKMLMILLSHPTLNILNPYIESGKFGVWYKHPLKDHVIPFFGGLESFYFQYFSLTGKFLEEELKMWEITCSEEIRRFWKDEEKIYEKLSQNETIQRARKPMKKDHTLPVIAYKYFPDFYMKSFAAAQWTLREKYSVPKEIICEIFSWISVGGYV